MNGLGLFVQRTSLDGTNNRYGSVLLTTTTTTATITPTAAESKQAIKQQYQASRLKIRLSLNQTELRVTSQLWYLKTNE